MFFSRVQLYTLEEYLIQVRRAVNNHENTFIPINHSSGAMLAKLSRLELLCRTASSLCFVNIILRDWTEQTVGLNSISLLSNSIFFFSFSWNCGRKFKNHPRENHLIPLYIQTIAMKHFLLVLYKNMKLLYLAFYP